jgi:hypothetical protein
MSKKGIRLVPRGDAFAQLVDHSMAKGWDLEKAVGRDPERGLDGEITYRLPSGGTRAYLRDDLFVGFPYYVVVGPDQERAAAELRAALDVHAPDELLAMWDRAAQDGDVDGQVDAVLFLGVASPEREDPEILSRIRAGLRDEDKDVRNAAVAATAYADWRAFRPDLQAVAVADPDAKARERARFVLDGWAREDGSS